jgi:hypothetical protein
MQQHAAITAIKYFIELWVSFPSTKNDASLVLKKCYNGEMENEIEAEIKIEVE